MDQNERGIIDDLFDRLRRAEGQSGPRDPEAEALIAQHVAAQPPAPYYMAQAIVVQQEALAQGAEQGSRTRAPARRARVRGLFGRAVRRPGSAVSRRTRARRSGLGGPRLLSTGERRGRLSRGRDADCARRRERLFDRGCDLRTVLTRRCGGRRSGGRPALRRSGRRPVLRRGPWLLGGGRRRRLRFRRLRRTLAGLYLGTAEARSTAPPDSRCRRRRSGLKRGRIVQR